MLANYFYFFNGVPSQKNSAFSLVEVITITSLLLILIGLGLGAYFDYQAISFLNRDIHDTMNLLEKTRFKALKNPSGDNYGVYIDTTNNRIISFRDAYIPDDQENIVLELERIDDIDLDIGPVPGLSNEIVFQVGTGKVSEPGSFIFHDTKRGFSHSFNINSQGVIE